MQYTVGVRKSPEGFYLASCPQIPEAHAQGETYEACLANIQQVLQLCLEFRKERGEEIPDEAGANQVSVVV
ncbi:MAG: type II toxin-antitoxin system HicB family antitoxin [Dehalococcoidia bacterium]|nr:type II toxin-antitoxin system HicB family antitoxin [Dehalococcoidia bacterium]